MTQDERKAVYIMGVLLLAIVALGPLIEDRQQEEKKVAQSPPASGSASVGTAQKWQVNDRYDGGTVRTAEATVRTGEPTTHIAGSVALSYGCNYDPSRAQNLFGSREVLIESLLLVARSPLRSRDSTGRKTLYGSYGVDGTSIESNSRSRARSSRYDTSA